MAFDGVCMEDGLSLSSLLWWLLVLSFIGSISYESGWLVGLVHGYCSSLWLDYCPYCSGPAYVCFV